MGGYFDYSPPEVPNFSEALGVAIERRKRRQMHDADMEQRRQQHEQDLQFQREQEARKFKQNQDNIAYQNRIIDERAKQDRLRFSQQQQEHEMRNVEAARKAYAEGNPELAQSIMSQTRRYDPVSGRETARGSMTVGQAPGVGAPPVMPAEPDLPDRNALETMGQLNDAQPTGKNRRGGAMHGIPALTMLGNVADMAAGEADAQRGEHDTSMRRFEADTRGYAADMRRAENDRPVTMKFGEGDPGVTFTRGQQRYASRQAAADDFANSLSGVSMSDNDRASASQIHAGILSGAIDPSRAGAMFQKERIGVLDRGSREGIAGGHDATRIKVAEINASRPRGGDWKEMVGRGHLALRAEEAGNRQFQQFIASQGYKADVATMKDLVDTNRALKVGNSALDVTAGAQFAKKAQGAGVLTDKDYDRFWSAIGGAEDRPENWFDMVISGQMGEGKRRTVVQAIMHKVDSEERRLRGIATQADKKFANEPWYAGTRAAYFDFVQGLPGMGQAAGPRIGTSGIPRRGGPPEVNARKKAKAKAAGASLDDAMQ